MNNDPTEAQKKAGNYAKEHRFVNGMRLSIENKAGSTRRGVDQDGVPWESEMSHDYGYIRNTKGKDKDHIDVFLGEGADDPANQVHVIDQNNPAGEFDEHKVMMGFKDANDAYTAYHQNYPAGHDGFDGITSMDLGDFKKWAFSGKGAKQKRVSDLAHVTKQRQKFAVGGTVGTETVGQGKFGGGAQNTVMPIMSTGAMGGASPYAPASAGLIPGQGVYQGANTKATSNAPTYDLNTPEGNALLGMGGAMGAGSIQNGIKAFMPGINQSELENWNNADSESGNVDPRAAENAAGFGVLGSEMKKVAGNLGFDVSKYDTSNLGRFGMTNTGDPMDKLRDEAYQRAGGPNPYDTKAGDPGTMADLYRDMDKSLSNYKLIKGASAGWDGKGNPRSTAETMYYQSAPNVWTPTGDTSYGAKAKHKGWAREEGAETLAALSVMMPMFTGAAGIFGAMSPAASAGANAALGAVRGGGMGGVLGSLGGYLGGQAGGALGASSGYAGVGSAIGSKAGSYLGNQVGQKMARGGPVKGALRLTSKK